MAIMWSRNALKSARVNSERSLSRKSLHALMYSGSSRTIQDTFITSLRNSVLMTDLKVKCHLSIKIYHWTHLNTSTQQEGLTAVVEEVMDRTMGTIRAVILVAVM
jgi:hypothetical protein